MQQPPPLADFGPLDAVPRGLDAPRVAHDHHHHDISPHCAPTALSATAEFSSGASPMARTAAYSSTSASVRASAGQGPLSSLPIARSYAHAGREQERSRHHRVSTESSPRGRQNQLAAIPVGVRSAPGIDQDDSIKGVPWWRRCRVPFFSFGIAFVLLVVGSVATLVLVLNPMIHDRSTASVETATRGALVAVAERVARPFRILQTVLRLHALDNEASGDTCADGRTSLEPSRRYITKYATSMETSIGTFPIWIAYHMFRAPRPSGETWTFCGCTSGAYGYDNNHCDSFNQSHLVETKLGLPVDLTVVRTGIYNRTTAAYMPPIYALRENLDAEGVWSEPQPYVYPGANKFVTTLQIHMPIRFRYNWEFDVDPILMDPNNSASGPAAPPVYTLRASPRAGLNASDPALALPGQPFARKVSMTESIEVLLEGINALLLATAPDHAEVALIHAATEILIASTYHDIPIFDLANGQPQEWHARRTPNAVLNAATADVFDRHLKSEITEALAADARREPLSQHLGVVTPSVHMTESWIVTAGLLTPGHGFVLCFITITERQPYYQRVLDARLSTFLIAAFVCVFCIVTVLVVLLLIHGSLASLREATVAAATLQLDSKTLRKRGKSVVQEIADLQDSFAAMNDMLVVAGSYLPHGVRTEWLQRRHSSLNQAGSSSSSMTHVLTAGSAPSTSAAGRAYRYRNCGDATDQLGDDDDELEFIDEDDRDKPTNEGPPVAKMQLRMPKMASHQRYVAVLHINVVGFHSLVSALEAPRGRGPNSHSPARSSTATARTSARHTPLARPPLAPPRRHHRSKKATVTRLGAFTAPLDHLAAPTAAASASAGLLPSPPDQLDATATAGGNDTRGSGLHSAQTDVSLFSSSSPSVGGASPRAGERRGGAHGKAEFTFASPRSKLLFLADDTFEFIEHLTAIVVEAATRHGGVLDSFQGDRFVVTFNAVSTVDHPELRAFCCAAMVRQETEATKSFVTTSTGTKAPKLSPCHEHLAMGRSPLAMRPAAAGAPSSSRHHPVDSAQTNSSISQATTDYDAHDQFEALPGVGPARPDSNTPVVPSGPPLTAIERFVMAQASLPLSQTASNDCTDSADGRQGEVNVSGSGPRSNSDRNSKRESVESNGRCSDDVLDGRGGCGSAAAVDGTSDGFRAVDNNEHSPKTAVSVSSSSTMSSPKPIQDMLSSAPAEAAPGSRSPARSASTTSGDAGQISTKSTTASAAPSCVVSVPISCGIAVGPAVVGDIGSSAMRRIGILGSVVGESALLERLCRSYAEYPTQPRQNSPRPTSQNHYQNSDRNRSPSPRGLSPRSQDSANIVVEGSQPPALRFSFAESANGASETQLPPAPPDAARCECANAAERYRGSVSFGVSASTLLPGNSPCAASELSLSSCAPPAAPEAPHQGAPDQTEVHQRPSLHAEAFAFSPEAAAPIRPAQQSDQFADEPRRPGAVGAPDRVMSDDIMGVPVSSGTGIVGIPPPSSSPEDVSPNHTPDVLSSPGTCAWCAVSEAASVLLLQAGVQLAPIDFVSLSGSAPPSIVFVVVGCDSTLRNSASPEEDHSPARAEAVGREAVGSLAGDKGTPLVGEGSLLSYANYHWAPNTTEERRKNAAPDAAVPLPDAFKVVGDQASARGAWCRSVAILSRSLRAAAASKKTSEAVRATALPSCPEPTVEDEIGTMMECTVSRSCTTHAVAVLRMHRAALAEPSPVGSAASAAGRCLGPLWEG